MPRRAPNLESVAAAIYSRDHRIAEEIPTNRTPAETAVARAAVRQSVSYDRVGNHQVFEQRLSLHSPSESKKN